MICPNCSLPLPELAVFCGRCGARFPREVSGEGSAATEKRSGEILPAKRQFCGRCGSELRANGECMRCAELRTSGRPALHPTPSDPIKIHPKVVIGAALAVILAAATVYGFRWWQGDTVTVRVNVPQAAISINGEEKGHTAGQFAPLSIGHLHGGSYSVAASAVGFEDARVEVKPTAGSPHTAMCSLTLMQKPAGLRIEALPGSQVLLNSRFHGVVGRGGSWSQASLPPGEMTVAVRHPGRAEWIRQITLAAGTTQDVAADQPELTPPPSPDPAPTLPATTPETGPAPSVGQQTSRAMIAPNPPRQAPAQTPQAATRPAADPAYTAQMLHRSQEEFRLRRYDEAANYCAEALRSQPESLQIASLCRRIETIRNMTK